MNRRDFFCDDVVPDLVLYWGTNWTALVFFSGLAGVHAAMALYGWQTGRWESGMAAGFAGVFGAAAIACLVVRRQIAICRESGRVLLRTGFRRLSYERAIPFDRIESVRLTLSNRRRVSDSRIEIVCQKESIDCPPTCIPRQQALCLALLLNARLIKIYGYDCPDVSERLDKLTNA